MPSCLYDDSRSGWGGRALEGECVAVYHENLHKFPSEFYGWFNDQNWFCIVVLLQGAQAAGGNLHKMLWPEYHRGRRSSKPSWVEGSEPLADALVYEPLPYRSALRENCTHVIVLRTRGGGERVTGKTNVFEKAMVTRFFGRKQKLPNLVDWMHNQVRVREHMLLH